MLRQLPDGRHLDNTDLLDSVAYTIDLSPSPREGIRLTFNRIHPKVEDICQFGSEVPIECVSINGMMYLFFVTDHDDAKYFYSQTLLLAKSTDGINFSNSIYTFSTDKFINVSVAKVKMQKFLALTHLGLLALNLTQSTKPVVL
jgi:hypothetical protein